MSCESPIDLPPGTGIMRGSNQMPIQAGTRLGPYEVLSLTGAGGMGEVWKARDTRLDRTVAIKVLPSDLTSDPAARQRFEREARAVAALSHPHICPLFDIGHQDGTDFLVMEFLDGETLRAAARAREAAARPRRSSTASRSLTPSPPRTRPASSTVT